MMNPLPGLPEIQMLWVGRTLSVMERLSISSFLAQGHPVRLFCYDQVAGIPEGTIVEDGRHILPETEVYTQGPGLGFGSLSTFSNRFRYELIAQRGGIWCDIDMICLKPFDFAITMDYFFASERMMGSGEGGNKIRFNCCTFKAPKDSELCHRANAAFRGRQKENIHWGETGPQLLTDLAVELNLQQYALLPDVLCPVDWWAMPSLISGPTLLISDPHGVHLWNEVWRRNLFDKDASYDPLSLYERFKARYLGGVGQ